MQAPRFSGSLLSLVLAFTIPACAGGDGADENQADDDVRAGASGASSGGQAGQAPAGAGAGGSASPVAPDAGVAGGGSVAPMPDAGTADVNAPAQAPAPGEYGSRAQLLAPNSEMAVAETGGKIYVLGGYPSSRVTQDTLQIFDPGKNEWTFGQPLPIPIHHPVLIGVAGKLYSLGGQPDTGRSFEYDPGANRWRELAPMPTARGAGAGAAIGDRIYVVGGRPPANNQLEVYDISDNEWQALPTLPGPGNRNHLTAAAIAGRIYVAGGRHSGGGFQSPMTDRLDIFDPGRNLWSAGKAMPRARGGVNGIAAHGCFYVWGGEGDEDLPNGVFPDHDVYDPGKNTWTQIKALPTPVHGVTGAAFIDGLIHMPGGGTMIGGTSGTRLHQVFRPHLRCDGS